MAGDANKRPCILVVDEHALSREAICVLLSRILPDARVFEICGGAEDCGFEPACVDLVLFGLRPPYLRGLSALLTLRGRFPATPVVLLSDAVDAAVIVMARARGASGLFHTSGSAEDLLEAIRQALNGKPEFPPAPQARLDHPDYRFSPRQVEVLDLLCKGKSNKEIGALLHMSGNTVRTHVAAIFNILGVRNRTEAVILGRSLI